MALVHKSFSFFHFFLYFTIISCCLSGLSSANRNIELDDNDWKQILEGEWMVLFYAPWCPACSGLEPAWREFYRRAHEKSLAVRAASVDITKWPALSGRFVVTTLPTLFHIKDAEVRLYKGPRNADAFMSYVEEKKWKQTEAISSWKAPQSLQMTLVAEFFRLSQTLRDLHTHLTEEYGLPTWGSYLIFALVTILVGTLLGLFLVCLIDLLYPPKRMKTVFISKAQVDEMNARGELQKKSDDEEELINEINEDIVDDAEKCRSSDPEKYSDKDSDEDEVEKVEGSGDKKAKVEELEKQTDDDGEKPSEVRKRRPRKAD